VLESTQVTVSTIFLNITKFCILLTQCNNFSWFS